MKTLFEILSTVFLVVGAVIGAGFISGRELISFFGTESFLPYLVVAFALFIVCFYFIFSVSSSFSSVDELNGALLKTPKPFNAAIKISCFISSAVMLSAIDEITKPVSPLGLPVYSALALVVLNALSGYGVKGAKTINLVLMPIIIIIVNLIIAFNGRVSLPMQPQTTVKGLGKVALYVSMNAFVNLPALADGARGKGKGKLLIIAVASAAILCAQGGLILATVRGSAGAKDCALPFLAAVGGSGGLFSVTCLVAVFTSLSTAFYPLNEVAVRLDKRRGRLIISAACFLTARLGVKSIVDYAYPVIGGFGAAYLIYCVIYKVKVWKNELKKNRLTRG